MLDRILESVRSRSPGVAAREDEYRRRAASAPPARDFAAALRLPGLSVIAEFKRHSPSAGAIGSGDPAVIASAYEAGGAAALSVLTEPEWFAAEPGDLRLARAATGLPVLRKDFMLHSAQVWETRAMGADAVLAIASVLDDRELDAIVAAGRDAGLTVVVEVHGEDELERALSADIEVIGVNNRDLVTFEVDLATAERLRPLIPDGVVSVAESGVTSPELAARMREAGYDAVLVGEAAMRSGDPSGFVRSLQEAA